MRIALIFTLLFTFLNEQNDTASENTLNFIFEDQISFMINDEETKSKYSLAGHLTESSNGLVVNLESITINDELFEFEKKISTNYTFLEFEAIQKTNLLIDKVEEAAEEVVEEAAEEVVEEAAEEVVEEAA
ncbi:hypothetical protein CL659_04305, partial [bacterium]|nr:hypothetical protein [bacterium]